MNKMLLARVVRCLGFAAIFVAFHLIFYGAILTPSLITGALITASIWSVGMSFCFKWMERRHSREEQDSR